jgi:DNA-binding MarR family transcriptional regulator
MTKLLNLLSPENGATAVQLAERASLGHSTVGKALVALESRQLARREPGTRTDHKMPAQLWLAATAPALTRPAAETTTPDTAPQGANLPAHRPDPAATNGADRATASQEPQMPSPRVPQGAETGTEATPARAPITSTHRDVPELAIDQPTSRVPASTGHPRPKDVPGANDAGNSKSSRTIGTDPSTAPDNAANEVVTSEADAVRSELAAVPPAAPIGLADGQGLEDESSATAPQNAAGSQASRGMPALQTEGGARPRLAKGALRQMVLDHLRTHPTRTLTPSRLGKELGRSSGAIANALDALVGQGLVELVTDKPRTFRLLTAS